MAEERDDEQFGEGQANDKNQQTTAQQGQQAGGQGSQPTMSGQPIGGNDSETGSGTTMSQGSDFGGQSSGGQSSGGQLSSGQAQSGSGSSGGSSDQSFIGSQGS